MIIDTKLAIEKSNGSIELAKELFIMLIDDLPKSLESIKSSFQSGSNSFQNLLDHAHRLHGSTIYCGVPNLKLAASNLENSIKNNKNNIQNNIAEVETEVQLLLENADTILKGDWN